MWRYFNPMSADALSQVFAALADPTRRAMLERLADGEATVSELMEPFALAQPTISKHLKVLERAGLVTRSQRANTRPCQLNAAPLEELATWVGGYRRFWEESLDRLDDYVQTLKARDEAARARAAAPRDLENNLETDPAPETDPETDPDPDPEPSR